MTHFFVQIVSSLIYRICKIKMKIVQKLKRVLYFYTTKFISIKERQVNVEYKQNTNLYV